MTTSRSSIGDALDAAAMYRWRPARLAWSGEAVVVRSDPSTIDRYRTRVQNFAAIPAKTFQIESSLCQGVLFGGLRGATGEPPEGRPFERELA